MVVGGRQRTRCSIMYGFLPYAVATIGADRILWGSDVPYYEVASLQGVLRDADISEADRERTVC